MIIITFDNDHNHLWQCWWSWSLLINIDIMMMTTISGVLPQFQAPCPRPCHRRRRGCSTWHSSLHWWRRWHRDDIVTIGDEDVWGFSVLMNAAHIWWWWWWKGQLWRKRLTHHIARAATATKPMLPVSHQSELNLKISDHKSLWLGKIISILCAVCLKYFLVFSCLLLRCVGDMRSLGRGLSTFD